MINVHAFFFFSSSFFILVVINPFSWLIVVLSLSLLCLLGSHSGWKLFSFFIAVFAWRSEWVPEWVKTFLFALLMHWIWSLSVADIGHISHVGHKFCSPMLCLWCQSLMLAAKVNHSCCSLMTISDDGNWCQSFMSVTDVGLWCQSLMLLTDVSHWCMVSDVSH